MVFHYRVASVLKLAMKMLFLVGFSFSRENCTIPFNWRRKRFTGKVSRVSVQLNQLNAAFKNTDVKMKFTFYKPMKIPKISK